MQPDYQFAIEHRKSIRTYSTEPIADKTREYLINKIEEINKESGLHISWVDDAGDIFSTFKSYGMFKNVGSVLVVKGLKEVPDLSERAGYFGEQLVLEATSLGLGTCWIAGTYDKKNSLLSVGQGETILSLISIGNIADNQSLKQKIIHTLKRKTLAVEKFYTAEGVVPTWFTKGIEAVQKAPSAINSQRVRFKYGQEKVTASVPGSRATDPIDMGIAKFHFAVIAGGTFGFGTEGIFQKL
ncbi:nitroreductase family protein [uncultured Sphaerochaeta sp.]|uniref:nitroreductase family protein n=1 Tax=uncultured Sphaerochaeta sp. TaxID=886478 RepID=UPI002A0A0F83|nr:nitroreductase family protein [uncultured Sphaerochaeta sp.]